MFTTMLAFSRFASGCALRPHDLLCPHNNSLHIRMPAKQQQHTRVHFGGHTKIVYTKKLLRV